ncbi:MAG: hypothetical protein WB947_04320 [Thermoplasmata archaeon]
MRWLVRFGYDGAPFRGWARQPGVRTVEGELRRGLIRSGAGGGESALSLEVASRTDRGVSARGNVLAFRSPLPGPALLRALNGIDPQLFFTAAALIADSFRVRAAIRRTYRYFEALPARNAALRAEATALFSGELDVRSLGRAIPQAHPVWRQVDSVTLWDVPGGAFWEIRAPSFVWGMVRKIVAAIREVDAGRLSVPRLRSALDGTVRLNLPIAEPEPLVLWEVEYDVPWTVTWRGPNRAQTAAALHRTAALWSRARVAEALTVPTPVAADAPA